MNVYTFKILTLRILFALMSPLATFYLYRSLIKYFVILIKGDDYIFYMPQMFPLLLLSPICILVDLFLILLPFPFRKKMIAIFEKFYTAATIYGVIAIALGIITSFVVSIYPLSTHYYKCDSTSVISSGSYYARTKEMCKERARMRAEEREASKEKPE